MDNKINIRILNESGTLLGEFLHTESKQNLHSKGHVIDSKDYERKLFELLVMLRLHTIKMELSILVYPDSEFDEQKIKANILKISKQHKTNELMPLSGKEMDVVQLILNGFSSKQIAEKLFISFNTVKTHRRNIFIKTGIKKVTDLNKIFNPLVKYTI